MPTATFLGTFSTKGMPGSQTELGAAQPKLFWFVWEDTVAKAYLTQQLDNSFTPKASPTLLPSRLFRRHFTREPKVTLIPDFRPEVADYLDTAFMTGAAEEQVTVSAPKAPQAPRAAAPEIRLSPAEQMDKDLRAEFAQSIMRYRKGNKKSALETFQRLCALKEGIVPAHKHMFTDFAVDLRKSKLYDLALLHFTKAVELSPEDSHANFNIARILFEMGRKERATEYLEKALSLEPDMKYALILKKRLAAK